MLRQQPADQLIEELIRAQVTQDISATIEYLLDYLTSVWQDIPWVAKQWPNWDWTDKEVFTVEWGLKEERLEELEGYAKLGTLTRPQCERYEALRRLIAANRPSLDRLLNE
ncbi:MAG: hypothetical protein H0T39_15415 [Actinobacteria bacterium]|nr:hypothetical protein [Actinomycetota bacterium]